MFKFVLKQMLSRLSGFVSDHWCPNLSVNLNIILFLTSFMLINSKGIIITMHQINDFLESNVNLSETLKWSYLMRF